VTFDDPEAQKRWKPNNFDVKFMGEVTLRTALQNSMNIPAIRVLDAVGLDEAIEYAKRLGITTELRKELGMALGSSCVTMGDLTNVYQLFANYGQRVRRRFIIRVEDRNGKVLFDDGYPGDPWAGAGLKIDRAIAWSDEPPVEVIEPAVGYLTTKLMRNVVLGGTGTGAQKVGVPVAGKTGTTNDSFDAWFVGFTTEIVTAAWVGYDDYVIPMGRYEQGGRAALPVWVDYMKAAVKKKTGEFEPPEDVVFIRIDPKTGMRARPDTVGAVREAYRKGSEPEEFVARAGEARPDEFFMLDN
jgi:penicillin-binding protein 1A